MRFPVFSVLLSLACLVGPGFDAAAIESLTIFTDAEMAPYAMMRDGDVVGMATDVVKAAMTEANLSYRIVVYPWLRAYDSTLKQDSACLYSTIITDERRPLFKWVGPLTKDDLVVWALAGSGIRLRSMQDLTLYRVGADQSQAVSHFLDDRGIKTDRIISADSNEINLKRLQNGHIDLWAVSSRRAGYFSGLQGVKLEPLLTLQEISGYLACNKSVPDAVIDRLNQAIEKMTSDGRLAAITRSYH